MKKIILALMIVGLVSGMTTVVSATTINYDFYRCEEIDLYKINLQQNLDLRQYEKPPFSSSRK